MANGQFLQLDKQENSLSVFPDSHPGFSFYTHTHAHTVTAYSLSRPVSHTITPVRRRDNPSQRGGGVRAASWVMSVDTCQKYSLCLEKAVCGVTAVRLPLAPASPFDSTTLNSIQPTQKASCVGPGGRKGAGEEPAGRVISTAPLG